MATGQYGNAPRTHEHTKGLLIVLLCIAAAVSWGRVASAQGAPKQAVVETSAGTFILDLTPDAAPNQIAYFMKVVQEGKPVGSIQEVTLARVLHDHSDPDHVTVGEVMARPLPTLETTVHLDEAYRLLLAGNTGVLAVQDGQVVDIVTRIDLIQYWDLMRARK